MAQTQSTPEAEADTYAAWNRLLFIAVQTATTLENASELVERTVPVELDRHPELDADLDRIRRHLTMAAMIAVEAAVDLRDLATALGTSDCRKAGRARWEDRPEFTTDAAKRLGGLAGAYEHGWRFNQRRIEDAES